MKEENEAQVKLDPLPHSYLVTAVGVEVQISVCVFVILFYHSLQDY